MFAPGHLPKRSIHLMHDRCAVGCLADSAPEGVHNRPVSQANPLSFFNRMVEPLEIRLAARFNGQTDYLGRVIWMNLANLFNKRIPDNPACLDYQKGLLIAVDG